jgi:hypothetical protein
MATFFGTEEKHQPIHSCYSFVASTLMFLSMITSGSAAGNTREFVISQQASPLVVPNNHSSKTFLLENELLMWVKAVGKRDHTMFDRAQNQITPLATIYVDQRRGFGHFTTVQAAIDHVPVHNHRRVHIIVAPGVYK